MAAGGEGFLKPVRGHLQHHHRHKGGKLLWQQRPVRGGRLGRRQVFHLGQEDDQHCQGPGRR